MATLTLELGWAPGDHLQAEDRVHRIGQEADSVNAYYMVAKGTIDERIMKLLDRKMRDISEIVDGKETGRDETMQSLMLSYWKEKKKEAAPGKASRKGPKM